MIDLMTERQLYHRLAIGIWMGGLTIGLAVGFL